MNNSYTFLMVLMVLSFLLFVSCGKDKNRRTSIDSARNPINAFFDKKKKKATVKNVMEAEVLLTKSIKAFGEKSRIIRKNITAFEIKVEEETKKLINQAPEQLNFESENEPIGQIRSEVYEVAIEIENLLIDFEDVKTSSEIYFSEINGLLNDLKKHTHYDFFKNDAEKIKRLYSVELNKATVAISEMEQSYRDIENFDKVLMLYSTLRNLEQQITRLKEITSRTVKVSKMLETFSNKSEEILGENASKIII